MNIAVIGLGLMGASLAGALKGFENCSVWGVDKEPELCRQALAQGLVEKAFSDPRPALAECRLIIFCVYARHIPKILQDNADLLRPGLIIADICGVKSRLNEKLKALLPPQVIHIGLHPMAGKEKDGFENHDIQLYQGCGFIICREDNSPEESLALMRRLARHIGAARIAEVSPQRQDEIIAYTSSLMHIAAAALCLDYHPDMSSAFTAGAFRDCTRVGDINAAAWTELLMDNRDFTLENLDKYLANLSRFRQALADEDQQGLRELLQSAGDNKRKMLKK